MANGDTKTESYLRAAAEGTRADLPTDTCCNTKTQNLILGVANRIMDVEDEVEELKNNPDVVDIVDTYQDLQDYDISTLTDKDIIRVLEDSTHNNSSTYYRWNATTNQFDYVGESGGSDGAQMEIVNLTITGVTQDGVAVLASKYNYEVVDLANANKNVVFKITIPSGSGLPAVGTYQLPLFNYSNDVVGSMSTVNVGGTLYSINFFYDNYDDDVNTGVLALTEIQTGGGGGFNILTEDDLNWYDQQTGDQYVALWLLPTGHYTTDENSPNVLVSSYEQDGDYIPGDTVSVEMSPLIIINNYDIGNTYPDIMIIYPDDIAHYIIDGSTGLVDSFQNYGSTFTGTDGNTDGAPGLVPAPTTADADKFLKSDGTWDTAGGARFFNIKNIVQAAYEDPGVQQTITLQEYEALEEACMDFLPLAYYHYDGATYTFAIIPNYDCSPSVGITAYAETISNIMGIFSFQYNNGQPYVTFTAV